MTATTHKVQQHGIGEVPVADGLTGLRAALDQASAEGWECWQVMIQGKNTPDGPVPHYLLLLRKPKTSILLPGQFAGRDG